MTRTEQRKNKRRKNKFFFSPYLTEEQITSKWDKHYNVDVTLKNISGERLEDWEIKFPFSDTIENIWNAQIMKNEDGVYYIKNVDWNQDIEVDKTVSFGMTVLCADNAQINIPEKCEVARECVEVETEYEVTYQEYSRWDNKVNGVITIQNLSDVRIEDWKLELETNLKFEQIWNAEILETDEYYCYLDNKNYNENIEANGSITFGFIATFEGEIDIAEYYLYAMEEPFDEVEYLESEIEEGSDDLEEDDFDTEEEYTAYQTVKAYYLNRSSVSADKSGKTKNTTYAKPVKWARKVRLDDGSLQYEVHCTSLKKRAIQAYAKVGDNLYITQRKNNTVYVTKCSKVNGKNRVYRTTGDRMTLKGFAHGQTLEMFEYKGTLYMLVGGNTRKNFSRNLAIIKFEKDKKIDYKNKKQYKEYFRITKLAYANQKKKHFGKRTGRIDAALSNDNKTLCVWFATDKNDDTKDGIDIGKIQVGCFKFQKILEYMEEHPKYNSLSFSKMSKKWCYYSCEQTKKSQFIRPEGSNQGIEVSNRYYVKNESGKKIWKNKIYFSAGNEYKKQRLYIGMMTLSRVSNSSLTKNGSYRTQLRIMIQNRKDRNEKYPNREMEGLHIENVSDSHKNGNIMFVVSPAKNKEADKLNKKLQYIYSIPRECMNENAKKEY